MRTWLTLALLLAVFHVHAQDADAPPRHSRDHHPQVSSQQCGLGTAFNVLADSGGIWLYRDGGVPREIFFHGGELSVDHQMQQVSAADTARLWEMERQARALMPQVAGIAHDVVDIGYDALGGVIEVMTGSGSNARKVERLRHEANGYVDSTLGKGRWDQHAFEGNFERYVEDQAERFKGSIARHLLWQIVTGRTDGIDARADRMGDALDARLAAKSAAIEARAIALCTQVASLRALQDALEFRYQGQPLQLLTAIEPDAPDPGPDNDATPLAAAAAAANDDTARDNAIDVQRGQGH